MDKETTNNRIRVRYSHDRREDRYESVTKYMRDREGLSCVEKTRGLSSAGYSKPPYSVGRTPCPWKRQWRQKYRTRSEEIESLAQKHTDMGHSTKCK
jgi:hypothetical protein